MSSGLDLHALKARLTRLGVDVQPRSPGPAGEKASTSAAAQLAQNPRQQRRPGGEGAAPPGAGGVAEARKGMADLFERISRVERAMNSAEAQGAAIQDALQEQEGEAAVVSAAEGRVRSPKPDKAAAKKGKAAAVPRPPRGAMAQGLINGGKGLSAAVRSFDHMRSIPAHTPLSSVLAQFKEAENAWAHEKARLRREALEERKRANKLELEARRQGRMLEHGALDAKALKTALKSRDSQLEAAGERIRELEVALARTTEEAALSIAALNAERDDLKSLLAASLQRLEAVDELVQRADISSAVMEDKMRALEEERTKALDAATRARAEVAELSESRRKLQWQSKLLEKMSEVQLKHNKRKSEAIRRLLNADQEGSEAPLTAAELDLLDDL